ncbi:LPD23 domain-containing protein [Hyphomonas sp. UBA4494]|jgi:hypothetical protein|uniref:LPD23 domain-containing protein n=1 Tax=Hyphomonas sp. UBA4494 TaxID=1946631 RepID=UPI0025C5D0F6|nr:LPD23 domain-containing protein [Hyphomonas sp. UBA4494]
MGWVGSLAKQAAKSVDLAPDAIKADLGAGGIGAGVGYAMPADSAEERARRAALLSGGAVAARRAKTPTHARDTSAAGFAGTGSKTADLPALERAQALEGAGKSQEDIWRETGWYRDRDGQFKYEIDDSQSGWKVDPVEGWEGRAGDALQHPTLFAAYPEIADQVIQVRDLGPVTRDAEGNLVSGQFGRNHGPGQPIELNSQLTPDEMRSTLLHETDHTIQDVEGFAVGGNPMTAPKFYDAPIIDEIQAYIQEATETLRNPNLSAKDKEGLRQQIQRARRDMEQAAAFVGYMHMGGEVAARNTQKRLNMTAEERRASFPDETIDVEPEHISVRRSLSRKPEKKRRRFNPWSDEGMPANLARYESPLELTEAQQVVELNRFIAFHGTNKEFDRFSTEGMGSGEGAQAFGPGLYFTENPGIADFYRKRIEAVSPNARLGDEPYNKSNPAHYALAIYWSYRNPQRYKSAFGNDAYLVDQYQPHKMAIDSSIKSMKYTLRDLRDPIDTHRRSRTARIFEQPSRDKIATRETSEMIEFLESSIAALEDLKAQKGGKVPKLKRARGQKGSVYTTALDMPAKQTILFDDAFSKQPEAVQAAFRELADEGLVELEDDAAMKDLVAALGDPNSPSMEIMRRHGIRGVKYLDGNSRHSPRGTSSSYNFVVFNDADIDIIARDVRSHVPVPGGAVPVAFGAFAAAGMVFGTGGAEAQEMPDEAGLDALEEQAEAAAAAELAAPEPEPEAPALPKGFVPAASNPTYDQFRATTVPGMEAAPELVSGMETNGTIARPDGGAVWGAAFRLENVVGSWLSKEKVDYGEWEEGFNPLDQANLEGYEQHADRFIDARTSTRMEQIKRQIDRETADRETLARSGLGGVGAQIIAGTIDPTIFIPVGGTVKKGESLLKIGGRFAAGGAAGAAVSELALTQSQELRTKEEVALNIAGGTVLGGLLGVSGTAVLRGVTGKPILGFDPDVNELATRFETEMTYDPSGDPVFAPARADQDAMNAPASPQSVGAARTDEPTLEDFTLAPSLGTAEATSAMRLNPLLRLSNASSARARQAGALLMENGMFLNRNKEGKASPVAVETAMIEYRGWHAEAQRTVQGAMKAHRKAGGKLSTTEFYNEVGKALRRGDDGVDEHVTKAARAYRGAIEKTKDRAIEAGLLPDDVEVTTAASYFHRMWNRRVMIRKPEDFKRMTSSYLDTVFENIRVRAAQIEAEQAQRNSFGKKLADDIKESDADIRIAQRESEKVAKETKAQIEKDRAQIDKLVARREDLSDEALDLSDQMQSLDPASEAARTAKARIDALAAQIRKLDEKAATLERKVSTAEARADGSVKAVEAKVSAGQRIKGQADELKATGKLSDEDRRFIQQARELMEIERVEGSLHAYRDEAATHIYDTLMGYDSRTLPTKITVAGRGPLKERTFNIPDLYEVDGIRAEDFLVSDAQEVMDRYMRVMSADIELSRAFGRPDMEDVFDAIKRDYDKLVEAAKGEKAKKRLRDEMDNRIADLRGVRDVIRGNFGQPTYDNLWARGTGAVRSWNYTTMLGGMTVSALPDVANKVLSHGFLGIARDLIVPLTAGLKNANITAKEARSLGIAVERTLATRIAAMADIGDVYGRATKFERIIGAMTNHFTTWTGMRAWNDVMKSADYIMAANRTIRAVERPDRMGKDTRTWLAQLGIGEGDYAAIRAQVRKYGQTSGAMRLANVDQWDDAGAKRVWIAAMGKNSNIQTVTPGAGDRPLMMNSELGKTIGQFKTFAFAANQRVTVRAAQQARMGHGRVVSALMSYVGMGMVVYYLKMIGSNRTPSDDPVVWVREGIDRSGVVSIFMEGFNTAEKVTGQTFVGDSPASRYASRNAFGSMLGPTFGRGQAATEVIAGALDGDLKDRDIHAVRKLMPYNNLFWLRTVFDELEIGLVDTVGAEETSLSDRRESLLE